MIQIERDKRGRLTGRAIATLTRYLARAIARAVSAGRKSFGALTENTRPGDWSEGDGGGRLYADILKDGKPSGARAHCILTDDGRQLEAMAVLCPEETYVWKPSPLEEYVLEQPIPTGPDDGDVRTDSVTGMITEGKCAIIPDDYFFTDSLDMERAVYRLAHVLEATAAYALIRSGQPRADFRYGGSDVSAELDDGVMYLESSDGRGHFFAYPLDVQLQACRKALAMAGK